MEKQPLSVTVNETAPCCIEMSVTVPAARAKKVYDGVIAKLSTQVKLPGFRAGKIPAKMLIGRYGEGIVAETMDQLLNDTVYEAAKEKDYVLASNATPEGETTYVPGEDFTYKVKVDVEPKFDLPEYKGLELKKDSVEVTDEEVNGMLDNLAESRSTYELVDRAAAKNDMLKVNFNADADEALSAEAGCKYLLKGENSWMVLREPEMLPGITSILDGLKAGDKKDAEIEYPADFRVEALRGKKLAYHFEVIEVHAFKAPEINDDFAKEMQFESVEDMKSKIRDMFKGQKESAAQAKMQEQAMELLLANQDFALPPTNLERTTKNILEDLKKKEGKDVKLDEGAEAALAAKAAKEAADMLRRTYILAKIADAENVQVTNEQIYGTIESFAARYGQKPEQVLKDLSKDGRLYSLIGSIREQNALKLVVDNAKVVEA